MRLDAHGPSPFTTSQLAKAEADAANLLRVRPIRRTRANHRKRIGPVTPGDAALATKDTAIQKTASAARTSFHLEQSTSPPTQAYFGWPDTPRTTGTQSKQQPSANHLPQTTNPPNTSTLNHSPPITHTRHPTSNQSFGSGMAHPAPRSNSINSLSTYSSRRPARPPGRCQCQIIYLARLSTSSKQFKKHPSNIHILQTRINFHQPSKNTRGAITVENSIKHHSSLPKTATIRLVSCPTNSTLIRLGHFKNA
ncbi:hypothetical protein WA016_07326 [Myxococcus stipitatus]